MTTQETILKLLIEHKLRPLKLAVTIYNQTQKLSQDAWFRMAKTLSQASGFGVKRLLGFRALGAVVKGNTEFHDSWAEATEDTTQVILEAVTLHQKAALAIIAQPFSIDTFTALKELVRSEKKIKVTQRTPEDEDWQLGRILSCAENHLKARVARAKNPKTLASLEDALAVTAQWAAEIRRLRPRTRTQYRSISC